MTINKYLHPLLTYINEWKSNLYLARETWWLSVGVYSKVVMFYSYGAEIQVRLRPIIPLLMEWELNVL